MNRETNRDFTFLLRLWSENGDFPGTAGWRAILEDARSGDRLGFANLEQLFEHLMQLAETSGKGPNEGGDPHLSS
jgi:hypothetical protein